jgi:hypothetical protein
MDDTRPAPAPAVMEWNRRGMLMGSGGGLVEEEASEFPSREIVLDIGMIGEDCKGVEQCRLR